MRAAEGDKLGRDSRRLGNFSRSGNYVCIEVLVIKVSCGIITKLHRSYIFVETCIQYGFPLHRSGIR